MSASKQLYNAHVDHSSDKFNDDLAQKISKSDSLEQFNFYKEMSVTDHIEILLLEKKIYHMKKLISAQDIDIISYSIDELISHNFYISESVDKEREF